MTPTNQELEAMIVVLDANFGEMLGAFKESSLLLIQEITKVSEMVNVNTLRINKFLADENDVKLAMREVFKHEDTPFMSSELSEIEELQSRRSIHESP